jgi:hypothetical protein
MIIITSTITSMIITTMKHERRCEKRDHELALRDMVKEGPKLMLTL